MATVTAEYKNPAYQINLVPHPDYGNGIIAQTPVLRLAILEEYIGRVEVTPSQMVATSKTGQKIHFSGAFTEAFETTNFTDAITRGDGLITGLTDTLAEDTAALRMTISGISIKANEFITNTTWSTLLSGNDRLIGGPGNDVMVDPSGLNFFQGNQGNDVCDGGYGIDTAIYQGMLKEYNLKEALVSYANQKNLNGFSILDNQTNRDGQDQLVDIERLQFSDISLALDTGKGEIAGSAYRLYKAAFDRMPEAEGLGFWINTLDQGANLVNVAQGFINSDEFRVMYGANPSDQQFVTLLYNHVLHRPPEGEGYQFWLNSLNAGVSRAQVLKDFSESTENINQTAELIANGIQYEAWNS